MKNFEVVLSVLGGFKEVGPSGQKAQPPSAAEVGHVISCLLHPCGKTIWQGTALLSCHKSLSCEAFSRKVIVILLLKLQDCLQAAQKPLPISLQFTAGQLPWWSPRLNSEGVQLAERAADWIRGKAGLQGAPLFSSHHSLQSV